MKRATLAAAGLAGCWLVIWLLVVIGHNLGQNQGPSAKIHTAAGYSDTVKLFLRHGWLTYDPFEQRIETNFGPETAMDRFYRSSFLRADVASFNSGDRNVFRIENGRIVGLDPSLHNILLPFSELQMWRGELSYRPENLRRAELAGKNAVIELIGPVTSLLNQENLPSIYLAGRDTDRRQRVRGEAVNVFAESEVYLGKTHLVGDAIIFNHRSLSPLAGISISGERVERGNRSRMDSGDLLKLDWRIPGVGRRYALLRARIADKAPLISSFHSVNGTWQRTPDDPQPRVARDLVSALNWTFQRKVASGAYEISPYLRLNDTDLALTLDHELQTATQDRLRGYCNGLLEANEPPFRAAVTVMDTLTGEILALASYPTARDLETWEESSESRARLLRNHNLSRLPIGSVAKVFLAAAIIEAAPVLADLKIPAYEGGEFQTLLGIELEPTLSDHNVWGGDDGLVDFAEFIEYSSNRYAAILLTLATGVDRDSGRLNPPDATELPDQLAPEDQFLIGQEPHDRRPRLRLPLRQHSEEEDWVVPGAITTLEHEPHILELARLFDIDISSKTVGERDEAPPRRLPGEGDDLVDTQFWMPLFEFLHGDQIPRDHSFFGVSPERENLAYNLIHQYRQQYLSVVLGGASSTWTNLKVCETLSRLVTGRRIEATLIRSIEGLEDVSEPWQEREYAALGMNEDNRRRLVEALTLVSGPNGTARTLNPALAKLDRALRSRGKTLGFFAKTGSPGNITYVPARTTRAVNELIRIGALELSPQGLITYRNTGPVGDAMVEDQGVGRSETALNSQTEDMAILRGHGVSARSVIAVCAEHNTSLPSEQRQFEIREGVLVRMLAARPVKSTGAAFMFTIGLFDAAARPAGSTAYLARIDVTEHQPERALTVAIVIETQGTGPAVAVPLAEQLITEVLTTPLDEGW